MQRQILIGVFLLIVCSLSLFIFIRRRNSVAPSNDPIDGTPIVTIPETQSPPLEEPSTSPSPPPTATMQPPSEQKLMEIAMEYLLLPGHTPDTTTAKLVPIKAGNPVYALVNCNDDGVAIRHNKKYLTVVTPSLVRWERRKISCFRVTSGFCGSEDYVMLRHTESGNFLRAAMKDDEEPLYTLVCKDAPTQQNFRLFCWKLSGIERKNIYGDNDCGCKFDPISGTEICKRCGDVVEQAPPLPDTQPGPFPEVVGFDVRRAREWILSQYPSLNILSVSCPQQTTACPPVQQPGSVVLYYNPDDNRVNRIPYVQ